MSWIGLVLAGLYLNFGILQLNRAEQSIYALAEKRGHSIEKIMVKPTIGNTILWRSIYLSDGQFYIDEMRTGFHKRIYAGTSIEQFDVDKSFSKLDKNTVLYNDIKRFDLFSDGFVSVYPGKDNVLGDVRYSMNPIATTPLWGVEFDPNNHQKRVAYNFYRDSNKQDRKQFINMLMNRDVNTQ